MRIKKKKIIPLDEAGFIPLVDINPDGDKVHYRHTEWTEPLKVHAKAQRIENDGWTKDRTMQRIATVPEGIFIEHPEFVYDEKAFLRWLKSPEGEEYLHVDKSKI